MLHADLALSTRGFSRTSPMPTALEETVRLWWVATVVLPPSRTSQVRVKSRRM